jgi:hypothetical protein
MSSQMTPSDRERQVLAEVLQAIRHVKHGYVQVIVQDSQVVQIDTMEKKRLDRPRT